MYRQIVKQLAFQLLTAFHVNVWDWHFLHIPAYTLHPPPHPPTSHTHTHTPSLHLLYFSTLPVSRLKKKAREWAGGDSEKGVNEEGEFKKKKETDSCRGWRKVSSDRLGG